MSDAIAVRFDPHYAPEIRRMRNAVFTAQQGIDAEADFDGQDPEAIHVLVA